MQSKLTKVIKKIPKKGDTLQNKFNMKAKLIIIGWLISLMLMPTDNLLQASIALCLFAYFSYKLTKHKDEVKKTVKGFENKLEKLINKQSI